MTLILETKLGFAMTREKQRKLMHSFLIPPMFLSQGLMSVMAFRLKQLKYQDQGFLDLSLTHRLFTVAETPTNKEI